jgi:hypothetical protein
MKAVGFPHLPLPTPNQSVFAVNHFTRPLTAPAEQHFARHFFGVS